MKIGAIITVFLISSVKFLFAPITGIKFLSYWETITVTTLGGWTGVCVFYFGASYFFQRAEKKRKRVEEIMRAKGCYVPPKKFTRMNKFIVRVKRTFGLLGLSILTPAIISIPFGCIIMARFYPNWKLTIPVLFGFVFLFSILLTTFGVSIFTALGWM